MTAGQWLPGAGEGAGIITNRHEEAYWSEKRVLKLDYGVECTTL